MHRAATKHVTQFPPSLPQPFNVVAALMQLHIHICQHILLKSRNISYQNKLTKPWFEELDSLSLDTFDFVHFKLSLLAPVVDGRTYMQTVIKI